MKKNSISFRAVRSGSYLHRFFLGKKNNSRTRSRCRSVGKAAVALAASAGMSLTAAAQCSTFKNADAANPLRNAVPSGRNVKAIDFVDIDGDGDLDCYVRYAGQLPPVLFSNIGTASHPVYRQNNVTGFKGVDLPSPTEYMQFVDIDNDGDYDCFMSDYTIFAFNTVGIRFYKNTGTPSQPQFTEDEADNPVSFFRSPSFVPFRFADIDGDGDYDFYGNFHYSYATYGNTYTYLNTGTKGAPVYTYYFFPGDRDINLSRTYYDWNKDGLPDYFGFDNDNHVSYYQNTGTIAQPAYVQVTEGGRVFTNGAPYRLQDLNQDGAPEAFSNKGHYSTVSPLAVIKDSLVGNGTQSAVMLSSLYQSADYQYKWERNGVVIPAADKAFIYATQPGYYTLSVTNACGTSISLVYRVSNNSLLATGAEKSGFVVSELGAIGVKAYPNPFSSAFTLQLTGKPCTVKITDMGGRVLLSQTTSATTLQTGFNLKAGTYMVEVWQDKKVIDRIKVIKE